MQSTGDFSEMKEEAVHLRSLLFLLAFNAPNTTTEEVLLYIFVKNYRKAKRSE